VFLIFLTTVPVLHCARRPCVAPASCWPSAPARPSNRPAAPAPPPPDFFWILLHLPYPQHYTNRATTEDSKFGAILLPAFRSAHLPPNVLKIIFSTLPFRPFEIVWPLAFDHFKTVFVVDCGLAIVVVYWNSSNKLTGAITRSVCANPVSIVWSPVVASR
jgi:hypothetical protein